MSGAYTPPWGLQALWWTTLSTLVGGMFLRIDTGSGGILAMDLLAPAFALGWTGWLVLVRRSIVFPPWALGAFVFGIIALGSWALGAWGLDLKSQALSFSYVVRLFSAFVYGAAAMALFADENGQTRFFRTFWIIFALILVFGFLQFYLFPDISSISDEGGWDPHQGRFLGTWLDPNFMAGFLALVLPFLAAELYTAKATWFKRRNGLRLLLFLLGLWAAGLTFSRSGYVALVLSLGLFFIVQDRRMVVLAIFAMLIGVSTSERAQTRLTAFSGTVRTIILQDSDEIDPTANLRIESWQRSLELWQRYPVLGIGYNTYRARGAEEGVVQEHFFSAGGSDSTHLTVLVTTGIIGFVSFLWFVASLFFTHVRRYFQSKNPREWAFVCGGLGLFVHAIFVNSFLFPFLFLSLMALSGVLLARETNV